MKLMAEVNVKHMLDEYVEYGTIDELERMYHFLDEYCVQIEDELIKLGEWEPMDE